jgi:hypothetical protein
MPVFPLVWSDTPEPLQTEGASIMASLDISTARHLAALIGTVDHGKPITHTTADGRVQWGVARAFTHSNGGFLSADDDVLAAFVWLSGGSVLWERWVPVADLLSGLAAGTVALDYRAS